MLPNKEKTKAGYHHGDLRDALLRAAEHLLREEGIEGLTLRAAAREAGVSHAAPKNHFDNLAGLLSDLAAVGFERFRDEMMSRVPEGGDAAARLNAIGHGYVAFAEANPELFLLMFRGERLDYERPALLAASQEAFGVLSGAVGATGDPGDQDVQADEPTLEQVAAAAASWSMVHGFAMLLLDGRLERLLSRAPEGTDAGMLLSAIFQGPKAED